MLQPHSGMVDLGFFSFLNTKKKLSVKSMVTDFLFFKFGNKGYKYKQKLSISWINFTGFNSEKVGGCDNVS